MNSVSSIALSGLGAARLGLDVSARNVANAMTPGYRRQQLVQSEQPGGGVSATVAQAPDLPQGLDGLDGMASDLVNTQAAAYSFKANLKVLQTSDRMMGALLDAFA
jgi:flagellar hook-associated protein FlgK